MRSRRAAALLLLACAVAAAAAGACFRPSGAEPAPAPTPMAVRDTPYEPGPQDMQLPELPTGCEATAVSTLLRLNGVDATKTEVADAMPKSDVDFVHSFLGNPYSEAGGCCMSPCAAETAQGFAEPAGLTVRQAEGRAIADLPTPCVVWVTIGLAEPQEIRRQGAYAMHYPSHCVTVLHVDGDTVETIDPLAGRADYPLDKFERVYKALGSQAVYIEMETP